MQITIKIDDEKREVFGTCRYDDESTLEALVKDEKVALVRVFKNGKRDELDAWFFSEHNLIECVACIYKVKYR